MTMMQQGMASLGEGERKLSLTLDRLKRLKEERPRIREELEALEKNVEDKLLQLGWTMEQGEVADCANRKEEAVMIEDVANMTMMEVGLEDDQVEPGSCSLSTWMNEEEPHDDKISIDTCVSFGHLGDGTCAGKGKVSLPRQEDILPWMTMMEPCMKKQGLSTVAGLVEVTCDLVMEGARARDKGGT